MTRPGLAFTNHQIINRYSVTRARPMALELSIRVKELVAEVAKTFGIHLGHAESLGDFRYSSRTIGRTPRSATL